MGPKLDPNRFFDAEALRKPLGGLLERSWRPPEPKKNNTGGLLPGPTRIPRPISVPGRGGSAAVVFNTGGIWGSLLPF